MKIERTRLPGVLVFTLDAYEDERGYFMETLNKHQSFTPVQANMSKSKKGVVRGLHYQKDTAKLVWVAQGSISDAAVDPETGSIHRELLSADNRKQMLTPANFLHGFQALEDNTIVCYLMDKPYDPKTEGGVNPTYVLWDLPTIISEKDRNAPRFSRQ